MASRSDRRGFGEAPASGRPWRPPHSERTHPAWSRPGIERAVPCMSGAERHRGFALPPMPARVRLPPGRDHSRSALVHAVVSRRSRRAKISSRLEDLLARAALRSSSSHSRVAVALVALRISGSGARSEGFSERRPPAAHQRPRAAKVHSGGRYPPPGVGPGGGHSTGPGREQQGQPPGASGRSPPERGESVIGPAPGFALGDQSRHRPRCRPEAGAPSRDRIGPAVRRGCRPA